MLPRESAGPCPALGRGRRQGVIADILDGSGVLEEIKRKEVEALALYTDVTDEQSTQDCGTGTVLKFLTDFGKLHIILEDSAKASVDPELPRIELREKIKRLEKKLGEEF